MARRQRRSEAGPDVGNLEHDTATNEAKNDIGRQLRSFIERIERMDEEKQAIVDDIKEIYAEAKGNGFDSKIMRIIIRRRKQDANDRAEQDALRDTYEHALGMAAAPADGN